MSQEATPAFTAGPGLVEKQIWWCLGWSHSGHGVKINPRTARCQIIRGSGVCPDLEINPMNLDWTSLCFVFIFVYGNESRWIKNKYFPIRIESLSHLKIFVFHYSPSLFVNIATFSSERKDLKVFLLTLKGFFTFIEAVFIIL